MMNRISRREMLERLNKKRENREIILGTSAGLGLVGKISDRAGIDLIIGYSTSPLRSDGIPSVVMYRPIFDSNKLSLGLAPRLTKVVENTPVIMAVSAADPRRTVDEMLDEMEAAGVSGIINSPSAQKHGNPNRRNFDQWGMGFPTELMLFKKCKERDLFTIGEVSYIEEDIEAIKAAHGASTVDAVSAEEAFVYYLTETVKAGVDMLNISFEVTFDEYDEDNRESILSSSCTIVQKAIETARQLNPDIIVTASGKPFEVKEDIEVLLENTDVNGVILLEGIEVMPVTEEIQKVIRSFKQLSLR